MAYESAAIRVTSELRSEILQGEIAPGARLSQQSTAERFGVSRIPVRDALQVLGGEGLVRPTSNATAVVTGMSIAELQELYERCTNYVRRSSRWPRSWPFRMSAGPNIS